MFMSLALKRNSKVEVPDSLNEPVGAGYPHRKLASWSGPR
jgi:hypothetical protein